MTQAPRKDPSRFAIDIPLLVALYALELAPALLLLAVHRLGDREISAHLADRPGLAIVAALAGILAGVAAIALRVSRARMTGLRTFGPTLATNLLGLTLSLGAAEATLRVLAERTPSGPVVFGLRLLPRSWSAVTEPHKAILARAETGSYLVAASQLGWTVGVSRRSANGLYMSSAEGLRSGAVGVAYRDAAQRFRVTLVGDSYSFCLDVCFEDSWGHRLEQLLGPGVQVLNFGVDGYGIDQAYLRYLRDARTWNPDVAILGVYPHDLERTMTVYPFIGFPTWSIPFSKPRFVVENGRLHNLNPTPLSAGQIVTRASVFDLPLVDLDQGFDPNDWRGGPLHASYLVRFLVSRFPSAREPLPQVSEAAKREVNAALLAAFLREAKASGAEPLLAYLPARVDMPDDPEYEPALARTREFLDDRELPYFDLTPTLLVLPHDERFVEGARHYSPRANASVAQALSRVGGDILSGPAGRAQESGAHQGSGDDRNPGAVTTDVRKRRS